MSSSDRVRSRLAGLLALVLLGGCTVSPLYGTSSQAALAAGEAGVSLGDLRGQIGVGVANTRTAQLFRNALLFRLNGGTTPTAPVYEIRYGVVGAENVVSIERGSGVPAASLYRMDVTYQVARLADQKVIATGTRFESVPFERSAQLFAASRALIDARELAARAVAEKDELAAVVAIRKDLRK
jgi:LPS-assembly lipoprotein